MVQCETLPLAPDTVVDEETGPVLTEPYEVGPYQQGIVFIKVLENNDSATLDVDIGISVSGYDDWDEHWIPLESLSDLDKGLYKIQLDNFGNWLRLQFIPRGEGELVAQAWFVGKG